MSSRKKRRNTIAGQFAARTIEMLESSAYRVLSLSAHRVWRASKSSMDATAEQENGRLPVTYEHFVEYGIHRHAIAPAMRELEALGFIEVTEHGRAGNAEHGRPNLFRITYRNTDRADPTHNWKRVESIEAAETIRAWPALQSHIHKPAERHSKKNLQCRKTPSFSAGNHHRNRMTSSAGNRHYSHGTETITTSISRVRGRADRRRSKSKEGDARYPRALSRARFVFCGMQAAPVTAWCKPFSLLFSGLQKNWVGRGSEKNSGAGEVCGNFCGLMYHRHQSPKRAARRPSRRPKVLSGWIQSNPTVITAHAALSGSSQNELLRFRLSNSKKRRRPGT